MSLLGAISNATSSLKTIQTNMQVISGNISNAGVDGYTTKKLLTNSDTNASDGAGGVRVIGYSRATSDLVSQLLNQSLSDSGLSGTQKDYISRVQDLMGASNSTPALSQALSDFAAAWKTFSVSPESTTNQQEVLYRAQNLASEIKREAAGLDKIHDDANTDMSASVTEMNAALERIYELNNEISTAQLAGQSSVNQEDLRDQQVQKLASLLKINVVERPNGRIAILTPGGASLLDNTPNTFSWNGTDIIENGSTTVTSSLTGGKLEALVGILDLAPTTATLNDPGKATIYKIQQQLDAIANLLANPAGTFAVAYNTPTAVGSELATAFFTPTVAPTRYNFAVNANLLNGTNTIKQGAAKAVSDDLNLANRSISAGNLSTTNVSYTTFANAMITANNQNYSQISDAAEVHASQKETYSKRLKDDTGVNVDEEVVRLTELQNNYSASARVITTVKQMFDIINAMVG